MDTAIPHILQLARHVSGMRHNSFTHYDKIWTLQYYIYIYYSQRHQGRLERWVGTDTAVVGGGGRHKAVVELLLARHGVEVDSKDNGGRTPLSWAAKKGHKAVNGRTPLSWAVGGGHEAVVALLLARHEVEADSKDNVNGNTYFRPDWQQQRRPVATRSVTTTTVLLISSPIILQDD